MQPCFCMGKALHIASRTAANSSCSECQPPRADLQRYLDFLAFLLLHQGLSVEVIASTACAREKPTYLIGMLLSRKAQGHAISPATQRPTASRVHAFIPVVMRRSSLGPSSTLTTALKRYALPCREWKLCTGTEVSRAVCQCQILTPASELWLNAQDGVLIGSCLHGAGECRGAIK